MACHAAIAKNFLSIPEDEIIEKALKTLKKSKAEAAVITDAAGKVTGLFSYKILLQNLSLVNVNVGASSIAVDSAPGLAKRLRKVKMLPVRELMSRTISYVYPETPTWEGLRSVQQSANPVVVIDQESQKPLGIITEHSLYEEFERMQDQ